MVYAYQMITLDDIHPSRVELADEIIQNVLHDIETDHIGSRQRGPLNRRTRLGVDIQLGCSYDETNQRTRRN